jgi:hypothetical protein
VQLFCAKKNSFCLSGKSLLSERLLINREHRRDSALSFFTSQIRGCQMAQFSCQKYLFEHILKGLGMKLLVYSLPFGIFIVILGHFVAICYFCGCLAYFSILVYCAKKNLATLFPILFIVIVGKTLPDYFCTFYAQDQKVFFN